MSKGPIAWGVVGLILSAFMAFSGCGPQREASTRSDDLIPDTKEHKDRPNHQEAISTTELSEKQMDIRIQNVSVTQHRTENGVVELAMDVVLYGQLDGPDSELTTMSFPVILAGRLLPDGSADLKQVGPVGLPEFFYGVAQCVDKTNCGHIVASIYYRNYLNKIVNEQFHSFTPGHRPTFPNITIEPPEVMHGEDGSDPASHPEESDEVEVVFDDEGNAEMHESIYDVPGRYEVRRPRVRDADEDIEMVTIPRAYNAIKALPDESIQDVRETLTSGRRFVDPETLPEPPEQVIEVEEPEKVWREFTPEELRQMIVDTPIEDFLRYHAVLVRSGRGKNQAVGYPNSGSLAEPEAILRDLNYGLDWYTDSGYYRWGTSILASFIHFSAVKMKESYSNYVMTVNRVSKRTGGKTNPHSSHQNGLDVDIAYPAKNNELTFQSVIEAASGRRAVKSGHQIVERTWELLKLMDATGAVNRFYVDRAIKNEIVRYAKSRGEYEDHKDTLIKTCKLGGHHNHIHINLYCTRFNQVPCRSYTPPPTAHCPNDLD